jgi:hypothetical protein
MEVLGIEAINQYDHTSKTRNNSKNARIDPNKACREI